MTDQEYNEAVYQIVITGRGFKAITDIAQFLETMKNNTDAAIREYRAERKMIRKIFNSNESNKAKVKLVEGVMFGEEAYDAEIH